MSLSVNVITDTVNEGQVLLDGVPISAGSYTTFTGCQDRVYAQVPMTIGTHVLTAPAPFQAYYYALTTAESLAFSLGGAFLPNAVLVDSTICHPGGPIRWMRRQA